MGGRAAVTEVALAGQGASGRWLSVWKGSGQIMHLGKALPVGLLTEDICW